MASSMTGLSSPCPRYIGHLPQREPPEGFLTCCKHDVPFRGKILSQFCFNGQLDDFLQPYRALRTAFYNPTMYILKPRTGSILGYFTIYDFVFKPRFRASPTKLAAQVSNKSDVTIDNPTEQNVLATVLQSRKLTHEESVNDADYESIHFKVSDTWAHDGESIIADFMLAVQTSAFAKLHETPQVSVFGIHSNGTTWAHGYCDSVVLREYHIDITQPGTWIKESFSTVNSLLPMRLLGEVSILSPPLMFILSIGFEYAKKLSRIEIPGDTAVNHDARRHKKAPIPRAAVSPRLGHRIPLSEVHCQRTTQSCLYLNNSRTRRGNIALLRRKRNPQTIDRGYYHEAVAQARIPTALIPNGHFSDAGTIHVCPSETCEFSLGTVNCIVTRHSREVRYNLLCQVRTHKFSRR
jgi:hypothetical protein